MSNNVIWSEKPASEWTEGYPVGNGRLGAMVLGKVENERIALNHDLLWRKYWNYQNHYTYKDIEELKRLSLDGKWDEVEKLARKTVAFTGEAIYINPYVPVGDLFIDFKKDHTKTKNYKKSLDMSTGIACVEYTLEGHFGEVNLKRETFVSEEEGLIVVHVETDSPGHLCGEISLSRIPDYECDVTGYSKLGLVVMNGEFEEGQAFSCVAKMDQRGGRLTRGNREYKKATVEPERHYGLGYVFSDKALYDERNGASTSFDLSHEITIYINIMVSNDEQEKVELEDKCIEKLNNIDKDYNTIKEEHIKSHQELYNKMDVSFGKEIADIPTDKLLEDSIKKELSPKLLEKFFNFSRYLSIASGRPQKATDKPTAPINLQGIWSQDIRPAWDCDYHLDLNLEMCYWPQNMCNLGELMDPLMTWVEIVMDQGRKIAKDIYGCEGIFFTGTCDYESLGNLDNGGIFWTGGAAWVATILWQHYDYTKDTEFLKNRLYPFLKGIGEFYSNFLMYDNEGRLVPPLSTSPEMFIEDRKQMSFASAPSTMDLELIRDIFGLLIQSAKDLNIDTDKIEGWEKILHEVPMPVITEDGILQEWLYAHEPHDQGHRHRSHLVGLLPGERISCEFTKDYADAAYKAIKLRQENGRTMTQSLTFVLDAQMLARLYKGDEALDELKGMLPVHVLENLLITCNDFAGEHGGLAWFEGTKLYQIEASITLGVAIMEMVFQDRQGVMRFLPALPDVLSCGSVKGLCARGGFEVDIDWEDKKVENVKILSKSGSVCSILIKDCKGVEVYCKGQKVEYIKHDDDRIVKFNTQKGKEYDLKLIY